MDWLTFEFSTRRKNAFWLFDTIQPFDKDMAVRKLINQKGWQLGEAWQYADDYIVELKQCSPCPVCNCPRFKYDHEMLIGGNIYKVWRCQSRECGYQSGFLLP